MESLKEYVEVLQKASVKELMQYLDELETERSISLQVDANHRNCLDVVLGCDSVGEIDSFDISLAKLPNDSDEFVNFAKTVATKRALIEAVEKTKSKGGGDSDKPISGDKAAEISGVSGLSGGPFTALERLEAQYSNPASTCPREDKEYRNVIQMVSFMPDLNGSRTSFLADLIIALQETRNGMWKPNREGIKYSDLAEQVRMKNVKVIHSIEFMAAGHKCMNATATYTVKGVIYESQGRKCTFLRGTPASKEDAAIAGEIASTATTTYVFPYWPETNKIICQALRTISWKTGDRFNPEFATKMKANPVDWGDIPVAQRLTVAGAFEAATRHIPNKSSLSVLMVFQEVLFKMPDIWPFLVKAYELAKERVDSAPPIQVTVPSPLGVIAMVQTFDQNRQERNKGVGDLLNHRITNSMALANHDAHELQMLSEFARQYKKSGQRVGVLSSMDHKHHLGAFLSGYDGADPVFVDVVAANGRVAGMDDLCSEVFISSAFKAPDLKTSLASAVTAFQDSANVKVIHLWFNACDLFRVENLNSKPLSILLEGWTLTALVKSGGLHTPDVIVSLTRVDKAKSCWPLLETRLRMIMTACAAVDAVFTRQCRAGVVDSPIDRAKAAITFTVAGKHNVKPVSVIKDMIWVTSDVRVARIKGGESAGVLQAEDLVGLFDEEPVQDNQAPINNGLISGAPPTAAVGKQAYLVPPTHKAPPVPKNNA